MASQIEYKSLFSNLHRYSWYSEGMVKKKSTIMKCTVEKLFSSTAYL
jgi:hypothetical protein